MVLGGGWQIYTKPWLRVYVVTQEEGRESAEGPDATALMAARELVDRDRSGDKARHQNTFATRPR